MQFQCPACGAEVKFKSRSSVFGVCSFCQSTLVRQDLDLKNIGKMTAMPEDMSPLQVGTLGLFEKKKFEVIGRQKIGWENGFWNEWYLCFEDGRDAWLGDAQGFYMMSFQLRKPELIPPQQGLQVGSRVSLLGNSYKIDDIHDVSCIGSEGELPIQSVKGRLSTSVDLVGADSLFGNIDYAADENRLFLGKYIEFDDLHFTNLRKIDGWD